MWRDRNPGLLPSLKGNLQLAGILFELLEGLTAGPPVYSLAAGAGRERVGSPEAARLGAEHLPSGQNGSVLRARSCRLQDGGSFHRDPGHRRHLGCEKGV